MNAPNSVEESLRARAHLCKAIEARQEELATTIARWLQAGTTSYTSLRGGPPEGEEACRRTVRDLLHWLQDPAERIGAAALAWPNLEQRRAAQLACSSVTEYLRNDGAFADLSPERSRVATGLLARFFMPYQRALR